MNSTRFLRALFISMLASMALLASAVTAQADPLQITTATNHTGYVSLQGFRIPSSTTGECISLSNSPAKTGPVNFYLDSQTTIYHTENSPPWDMLSGGTNDATGQCRLGTLATGNHYVKATWSGGSDQESFTVGPAPDTINLSVVDHDSTNLIDEDGNGSEQVDITFSGTNSANRAECSLSGATTQAWAACTSVWSPIVNVGNNNASVRSCDNAGCGLTHTLIFPMQAGSDTTPPETTITSAPSGATNSTSASIGYTTADNAGGTGVSVVECKLDAGAFVACNGSPQVYSGLTDGSHTVSIRAKDGAGNYDPTPAMATWTVDTAAPDTTITAQPSNPTTATTADFSFTSSETASFQCSLDGAAYASCASPKSYTGLVAGSHTFNVKSTDGAGNTDATPASYTWTVQAPPASDRLEYTTRTDHTGYSDLSGATLQPSTQYCVTLKSAADVTAPVNFYLDGTLMRTENTAPWDATNTLSTGACGTTAFTSGSHTISATWPNSGSTSDTFSVATGNPPPSGAQPWGPTGTWNLKFEDDFTQDPAGAVDVNKWTNNGWNNCTTSVADGAPGGGRAMDMYLPTTADNNGCQIRSKYAFTYGAIEARVYFPITPDGRAANHAGWWTYGNTSSSGEIDVMESGWCFIHNGSGGNATQGSVAGTWVGAWHTFTAAWESDGTVKIWWDGQLACNASNLGWDNQPVNVLFNHFIQPGYNLSAPAHMWAQYARVWQH